MGWNTSDIPDLHEKVAVVTGANGGLGLESARALAGAGAHVVMAARDQQKARAAFDDIKEENSEASIEVIELDLGSLDSVRSAADRIGEFHPVVDILINNAGVMAMPERSTEDGFEQQLGINHLGHWALTSLLMPSLLGSGGARVVTVTSTAHHFGRAVDRDNPHLKGTYEPWKAYSQSKLANYHFALGLQDEFEQRGLSAQSLVAHPGLSHTNLQVHTAQQSEGKIGMGWATLARKLGMTAADGALPQLRAATDAEAKGGQMYAPRFVNSGAPVRRPIMRRMGMAKAINDLWVVSERETGLSLDFD